MANVTFTCAEAAKRADALLEASAALRRELLAYERELRRARTRVSSGKPLTRAVPDLIAVRNRVSDCLDEMDRCRRRVRVAYYSLQASEGMSLGAIAREWGLSRQLVSRLMNDNCDDT
jgi:hypothetical protein